MPKYTVEVMSDKDFESLPYPDMQMSLGVADPKLGKAYVRYTGIDAVDKHLIEHELEHLIEKQGGEYSHHYRNGVYYKGFGEILQTVAPVFSFIPGIGPLLSAGAGIGGGALAGRAAKKAAESQQQPQQSLGGGFGQENVSSPMDGFRTPAAPNVVSPGSNTIPGGQDAGGSGLNQRLKGFFSNRGNAELGGFGQQ